jgi:putative transposase
VLRDRFGVSERRACTVVGIHRSTMRLRPLPVAAEESELRAWLRRFSTDRPRWGWRRAAKMARRAGWKVNNKRIRRLWREEGLRVPQRRKRKRLTGIGVAVGAGQQMLQPVRPGWPHRGARRSSSNFCGPVPRPSRPSVQRHGATVHDG